jgi:hypothetical protein
MVYMVYNCVYYSDTPGHIWASAIWPSHQWVEPSPRPSVCVYLLVDICIYVYVLVYMYMYICISMYVLVDICVYMY